MRSVFHYHAMLERKQLMDESIEQYAQCLNSLFETLEIVQENLKIDIFLRGLHNNELRVHLYQMRFPTLDACEECALSLERTVGKVRGKKHRHMRYCVRCECKHRFGHHVAYKR